jgi:hypothetical protein
VASKRGGLSNEFLAERLEAEAPAAVPYFDEGDRDIGSAGLFEKENDGIGRSLWAHGIV